MKLNEASMKTPHLLGCSRSLDGEVELQVLPPRKEDYLNCMKRLRVWGIATFYFQQINRNGIHINNDNFSSKFPLELIRIFSIDPR